MVGAEHTIQIGVTREGFIKQLSGERETGV
ncbi:Uncharacterised protein [Vibrio cholerae]|nr:Uncharacterised protein [Vibrio cholerae]